MNSDYQIALTWLAALASEKKFFKNKALPSLNQVQKALDLLGRPDKRFDLRVIVGGTAGKGTTCRYVEQTLLQAGKTVALISSPHLQVVTERIRLNGQLISKNDFSTAILKIKQLCESKSLDLTYYEVIVIAGIVAAAEAKVEILVCEVGIGGELDAVNAVQGKRIAAVTFIGEDHLEMFGNSIENLAAAKAGIFTADSILNLTYEQKYSSIFEKKSISKIYYLKGIKQKLNKKLARKICEQILGSTEFKMSKPNLPCRWEKVVPNIILDGAHSGPRFEYLKQSKLLKYPGPYTLVLGMQKNHSANAFKLLLPYAARIIWTELDKSAWKAEELQSEHTVGEAIKSPLEALKKAQTYDEPILVTGSFYLCGAIRDYFYSREVILEQQTEWPE